MTRGGRESLELEQGRWGKVEMDGDKVFYLMKVHGDLGFILCDPCRLAWLRLTSRAGLPFPDGDPRHPATCPANSPPLHSTEVIEPLSF